MASADWSHLSTDILFLIFDKLSLTDIIHSSAVCVQWNIVFQTVRKSRFVPFMVVQNFEKESAKLFAFVDGNFHTVPLPNLDTLYSESSSRLMYCFGASNECLITVDEHYVVRLVHPLTWREICQLPPLKDVRGEDFRSLDYCRFQSYFKKAVVLPSETPTVMIIHDRSESASFIKLGDKKWRTIRVRPSEDAIVYCGKLHTCSRWGIVKVWEPKGHSSKHSDIAPEVSDEDDPDDVIMFLEKNPEFCNRRMSEAEYCSITCFGRYLVASADGEHLMFVLVHFISDWEKPGYPIFRVFLLDKEKFKWTQIRSLGKQVLFLGNYDHSVCYHASMFPDLQPNCIYFAHENFGGVYDMRNNIMEAMDIPNTGNDFASKIWFAQKL